MVPAVTRFARTKTTLVLAAAGGLVLGAALLGGRPPAAPPTTCIYPPGHEVPPPPLVQVAPDDLTLTARPTSRAILRGTSEAHLAVTIQAPRAEAGERPPVDLAIVLDTSGSMAGDKIRHAKAAARHLVDELGPRDRFALVSFSTHAEVLVPLTAATPAAKQRATAAIGGLYDDGGTNLGEALDFGARALADGDRSDDLRRLVLISDGEPEDGEKDPTRLAAEAADIAARGVSISAVGVGLDFNERIMTDLSVSGRGNYYFVEDTAQLASLFDHELDSLGQTVAAEAELVVTPAPGVDVLEAYGYRTRVDGGATIVPIADLRAGETRKVVVALRVTTPGASATGAMDLADVRLTWRPRDAHQRRAAEAMARVDITDSSDVVRQGLDRDAVRQVEEARTARAIEQATEAYQAGNGAAAQGILDRQRAEQVQAGKDVADDELTVKLQTVTADTAAHFAAAPAPSAAEGQRAAKASRRDAYDLAR